MGASTPLLLAACCGLVALALHYRRLVTGTQAVLLALGGSLASLVLLARWVTLGVKRASVDMGRYWKSVNMNLDSDDDDDEFLWLGCPVEAPSKPSTKSPPSKPPIPASKWREM